MAYKGPKLKDLRGTKRQKRIEDLLANANTRKHVPTADLPSNLRKERVKNARLDAPFVAGSDVSNRDVARDREAELRLAFDPEERELARQQSESVQRERTAGDYFAAYQNDLKAAVAQQAADADRFQQAAQRIGDAGQQADTAQAKELQGQADADAKLRGATADPQALQRAAQASQVRRAETDRFGALMTTQAQSAHQSLGARAANVPPLMDLQNRKREGDVRSRLQEDTLALSRKKGDARLKYMTERRDAESKRGLERLLFEAETADKLADNTRAEREAAERARQNRESRSNIRADNRRADEQARIARERDAEQRERGTGPYRVTEPKKDDGKDEFGNTRKDRDREQRKYDNARAKARPYIEGTKDWQELRDFLVTKNVDSVTAAAVAQEAKLGRVGPDTSRKLKRRGVATRSSKKGPSSSQKRQKGSGAKGTGRPS